MLLLWTNLEEQIPPEELIVAQEFDSSHGIRILLSCWLGSEAFNCSQAECIEFVCSAQLSIVWQFEYFVMVRYYF